MLGGGGGGAKEGGGWMIVCGFLCCSRCSSNLFRLLSIRFSSWPRRCSDGRYGTGVAGCQFSRLLDQRCTVDLDLLTPLRQSCTGRLGLAHVITSGVGGIVGPCPICRLAHGKHAWHEPFYQDADYPPASRHCGSKEEVRRQNNKSEYKKFGTRNLVL